MEKEKLQSSALGSGVNGVEEILSKLQFISTVKTGEKISTTLLRVQDSSSWYTSLIRAINRDSRAATYTFIKETLDRAFDMASTYGFSDNTFDFRLCVHLVKGLIAVKNGIINLQRTYEDDRMFVCQLSALLKTAETKIIRLIEGTNMRFDDDQEDDDCQDDNKIIE